MRCERQLIANLRRYYQSGCVPFIVFASDWYSKALYSSQLVFSLVIWQKIFERIEHVVVIIAVQCSCTADSCEKAERPTYPTEQAYLLKEREGKGGGKRRVSRKPRNKGTLTRSTVRIVVGTRAPESTYE